MIKKEFSYIAIIIVLISILTIFLGLRKTDYYIDEVWTFGLANNIGSTQPDIEFGKTYTGLGPFEDFVEVKKGEGFNYINVWQNQANDVHPPLYYVFIHTICSLFPDTFSKWYGIALNIIWMAFITVLLYLLSKEITCSIASAIGIVLAYETTTMFFDTLLFIRMYAQLTVATLAISLLIKKYWDKNLDKRFYTWFTIIILFGMLTHYYFLIFTFFICSGFTIRLFKDKRFTELKRCIITTLIDGIAYLAIWYHFAGHLFRGYRGKQAINAALTISGFSKRFVGMISIINNESFAGLILLFAIVIALHFCVKILKKDVRFSYENMLFLSACFYTIVVSKIAPFIHSRYVMPVAYVYTMMAYLAVLKLISLRFNKKWIEIIIITFFLVLNFWSLHSDNYYVPMDYHSEKLAVLYKDISAKDCIVVISDLWESLYFYVPLQNAQSYVFVTSDNMEYEIDNRTENSIIALCSSAGTLEDKRIEKEIYKSGSVGYFLR